MPQFFPPHAALVEFIRKLVPLLANTAQMLQDFMALLAKLSLLPQVITYATIATKLFVLSLGTSSPNMAVT